MSKKAPEELTVSGRWGEPVVDYPEECAYFRNVEYTRTDLIPQWISVDERLPDLKHDTSDRVLCAGYMSCSSSDFRDFQSGGFYHDGEWYTDLGDGNAECYPHVTHWQPLPPPPTDATQNAVATLDDDDDDPKRNTK